MIDRLLKGLGAVSIIVVLTVIYHAIGAPSIVALAVSVAVVAVGAFAP